MREIPKGFKPYYRKLMLGKKIEDPEKCILIVEKDTYVFHLWKEERLPTLPIKGRGILYCESSVEYLRWIIDAKNKFFLEYGSIMTYLNRASMAQEITETEDRVEIYKVFGIRPKDFVWEKEARKAEWVLKEELNKLNKEFNHLLSIEKFIEDFLNRIDEIMVLRNFSRAELAKRMKCTEIHISKIMRREKPLTAETMADMAFYLNLDLEIIIKEKDNVQER